MKFLEYAATSSDSFVNGDKRNLLPYNGVNRKDFNLTYSCD